MESIIKIENLNVIYFLGRSNEVTALKDINLEIYPGEFIIFFGPSGCGKSTLLYSITGLETNTQGNILVSNRDIANLNNKELEKFRQKDIGMIFQAYYLITSLSVMDNVILPQVFLGAKRAEREKKALALLEHFGVKQQAHKLPSELSGGQQQRVAICRSLINDPEILFADEPVGNLDSKSADDVMNLLRELNENQKKTIILVTHNPAHLSFAHRVFYMKDGRITETKVNKAVNREVGRLISEPMAVSKDMELLIRTYTNLSSDQVGNLLIPFKAKQIVSEVLIGMTSEDVGKIEKKVIDLLIRGINDDDDTFKFLDIDDEAGGMGMDRRTARKLADKIKDIIKEIKSLEEEEEKLKNNSLINTGKETMEIRHYLLDLYKAKVTDLAALAIIDQTIDDRMSNRIDKATVQKKLDLSLPEGAGLNKKTAKKIAQRLELLILGKFK